MLKRDAVPSLNLNRNENQMDLDLENLISPKRRRHSSESDVVACVNCDKLLEKCVKYEKRISQLKNTISIFKQRNKKIRQQISRIGRAHARLRGNRKSKRVNLTSEIQKVKISEHSKVFCGLLMGLSKSEKYNREEKELSQNIFYRSQSAYKFLREGLGFRLPHISTLYRWAPVKGLQPGFINNAHNCLKSKIATLSQREQNVVLIFDEIRIRPDLTYNIRNDVVDGYEDLGSERKPLYANEICVFMVNGLYDSWKSVLNYFVSENGIKAENLKEIIEANLKICQELGLKVRAIVCDQGPNNRKFYKLLNVSEHNPFTIYNSQKIYCFYDFPHLIKSLRNLLLKSDLETLDGKISFDVFKEIYNLESENIAKTCLKFTSAHLAPNAFEKMRVSLATQVFSRTSAAAIKTAHQLNCLQYTSELAQATQMFTIKINDLFDSMNSGSQYDKNILKRGVKVGNVAYNYIKDILKYLNAIQISPSTPRNFCLKGLEQTLNGVILLSEDIANGSFPEADYLLTKKIHQDVLENLFSVIRIKGGNNKNPSVYEFNVILSKILSSNLITFTPLGNCDDDDVEFLRLNAFETESTDTAQNMECKEFSCDESLQEHVITTILEQAHVSLETTAMRYFAGYLAHKMLSKQTCSNCSQSFQKNREKITCPSEFFIFAKNFSQNSDFGSLLAPTDEFFSICKFHFKIFHVIFKQRPHMKNIRETMALECIRQTNLRDPSWFDENYICFSHRKELLYFALLVLLRKHCSWRMNKRIKSKHQKIQILSAKGVLNHKE